MSDEATNGSAVPVTFTTIGGNELAANIDAFAAQEIDEGPESYSIRVSMAFEAFQTALADEAFNLFPGVLIGDGVSGFEPGRPVTIDARLRDVVARSFTAGLDAAGVADNDLLLRADSWLALRIMQALELPPEIGDNAFASLGVDTTWGRPPAPDPGASITSVARQTLGALGYQLEDLSDTLCRAAVERNDQRWTLLVLTDEDERTCVCWSVYPELAAPEQRAAVAQFLMEGNYDLSVGSFELDPEDGEIRFRTSIDLGGHELTADLFTRLMVRNLEGMGRAFPMLAAYFQK